MKPISLDKERRARGGAGEPAWLKNAQRDAKGAPLGNHRNAMLALREAEELQGLLGWDEMMCDAVLLKAPPSLNQEAVSPVTEPRLVNDNDVSVIQEWLQDVGLPRLSSDTCHQAIEQRAQERKFHPVRDFLEGLSWDGVGRLESWLTDYLGATRSEYTNAVGALFMTSLIARVFEPGCKADHMLVLEGEQGARKSTACEVLAGKWFSDNLPDISTGKDASQHLKGKWLIEIGELSALSRAASATLKDFVSRTVERYRPPYGRKEIDQPRQCVFIGTTNEDSYLKDETGGRRFWPVKTGRVDIDALRRDRNQLLAEALVRYRKKLPWWPDAGVEKLLIKPQQEARYDRDVWEEPVLRFLRDRERVFVGQIAREALHMETNKVGRADQNRITRILKQTGWLRLSKDADGNIPWAPQRTTDDYGRLSNEAL